MVKLVMSLIAVTRLVCGLIVVSFGFLVVVAPREVTVAGDVTTYSSTWKATENLIARRVVGNHTDEIIIGVASWKVLGQFAPDGPYFKEEWSSPSTRPFFGNRLIDEGVLGEWITGAIWVTNLVTYNIFIEKKSADAPLFGGSGKSVKVDGKTASCASGTNGCIFGNGSYGFTDYHEFDSASNGKHRVVGVAIPTLWTVTGTVCELNTDIECR